MFAIPDLAAMSSSSTLVETVSLDYDDFSDSFLTCGTCLCQYDAAESAPKLLPCSHTVCRSCLERIVEASRDNTQVRCPICRESTVIPRGGVSALPPSFLVNQLRDLMARQRRDVVPKCSRHAAHQLLFCETCDAVFCAACTSGSGAGGGGGCGARGGTGGGSGGGAAHTVIPFSIAIKRMSEILLYKASLCLSHLGRALEVVAGEAEAVDASADRATDQVNRAFADVANMVEQRRRDVLASVRKIKDDKQRVLKDQLDIITAEKDKVESECHGLQQQVEVRNITKKISDLNDKLDVSSTLAEPRENSFMCFEYDHNDALRDLVNVLDDFGRIRISKTFPALCTAEIEESTVHLQTQAVVRTVDYHGNNRTSGADPICVELRNSEGKEIGVELRDHDDGTYMIRFTPETYGTHLLSVTLFGRAIRDSPFSVNVSEHNNPVKKLGSRGSSQLQFIQPCAVCIDTQGKIHVLDAGNSRIQVIDIDTSSFVKQSTGVGLEHRSCTGMCLVPNTDNIVLVNWRTKYICTFNPTGDVVQKFTCSEFQVPTSVAVNQHGETVVADNGLSQLLVFDGSGRFLHRIGGGKHAGKTVPVGSFREITSVYCTPDTDEILVTDKSRLQVFSRGGEFLHDVSDPSLSKQGQFGGVTIDARGNLLATRQEKGKCVILVFDRKDYGLRFMIDSDGDKLSRPSGLTTTEDGHVIVADLGNNCIKKYRYV